MGSVTFVDENEAAIGETSQAIKIYMLASYILDKFLQIDGSNNYCKKKEL